MKKSSTLFIVIFFSFFLIGCYKKYSRTIAGCNKNLFVEVYKNNAIDVAYDYLTDSSNFRMYVGKFDYEHGYYRYNCQGDSLEISETFEGKVINNRKYSLIDLRKGKEGF
jgi:hypothetical protein